MCNSEPLATRENRDRWFGLRLHIEITVAIRLSLFKFNLIDLAIETYQYSVLVTFLHI